MILSQFLWYFCALRNSSYFLRRNGSLDIRMSPHEIVGAPFWIATFSLRPRVSGFPFVCTMNHINDEFYTKYVAATFPRVCGSACVFLFYFVYLYLLIPFYHELGGQSSASYIGGPGSTPGQFMWNTWWIRWHRDRFCLQVLRFFPVTIILPILLPHVHSHAMNKI
jgi:hypothetical protein